MSLAEKTAGITELIQKVETQTQEITLLKQELSNLQSQNEQLVKLEEDGLKFKTENFQLKENLKAKDKEIYALKQRAEALSQSLNSLDSQVDYNKLANNLSAASKEAALVREKLTELPAYVMLNWIIAGVLVIFIGGSYWWLNSNLKEHNQDVRQAISNVYMLVQSQEK